MSGHVQQLIQGKIEEKFKPLHYEIVNESYKHSVPRNSETHFKVLHPSSVPSPLTVR